MLFVNDKMYLPNEERLGSSLKCRLTDKLNESI